MRDEREGEKAADLGRMRGGGDWSGLGCERGPVWITPRCTLPIRGRANFLADDSIALVSPAAGEEI
jgi:hypothetical protein